jgi:hypothetical protein
VKFNMRVPLFSGGEDNDPSNPVISLFVATGKSGQGNFLRYAGREYFCAMSRKFLRHEYIRPLSLRAPSTRSAAHTLREPRPLA